MKNKLSILCLIIFAFGTISCEDDLKAVPDENLIVVRAYIYEGQPVKDIVLMSTLALDDESTEPTPIDSAEVILSRGNEKFILEPVYSNDTTETDTTFSITYHYPDSNLVVGLGDTFRLEVNYMEQKLTAETVVPIKPGSFSASIDTLWVPEFNRNRDYVNWIFADSNRIQLDWDNPDQLYHYLLMDNVEVAPTPLENKRHLVGSVLSLNLLLIPHILFYLPLLPILVVMILCFFMCRRIMFYYINQVGKIQGI